VPVRLRSRLSPVHHSHPKACAAESRRVALGCRFASVLPARRRDNTSATPAGVVHQQLAMPEGKTRPLASSTSQSAHVMNSEEPAPSVDLYSHPRRPVPAEHSWTRTSRTMQARTRFLSASGESPFPRPTKRTLTSLTTGRCLLSVTFAVEPDLHLRRGVGQRPEPRAFGPPVDPYSLRSPSSPSRRNTPRIAPAFRCRFVESPWSPEGLFSGPNASAINGRHPSAVAPARTPFLVGGSRGS
jgi:hypothetical protein